MRTQRPEISKARLLRRWASEPQTVLWQALRNRQVAGLKFRRAVPLHGMIVDFYCPAAGFIVEITGKGQDHAIMTKRDAMLSALGFTVMRLRRAEVLGDLAGLCARIAAEAAAIRSAKAYVRQPHALSCIRRAHQS